MLAKLTDKLKKIISKATQCDEISNNQNLDLERQENEQQNRNSESEADTEPLVLEEQINAHSPKNQFDQDIPMDIDQRFSNYGSRPTGVSQAEFWWVAKASAIF